MRKEVVRALYDAALHGMQDAPEMEDASVNEVFSAALTLLNGLMTVLRDRGVPSEVLRSSLEQLIVRTVN